MDADYTNGRNLPGVTMDTAHAGVPIPLGGAKERTS